MKRLLLHPSSLEEIIQAKNFYNSKVDGLGTKLFEEVNRAFKHIERTPETWPIYNSNLRRFILKRFFFAIVYRTTKDTIQIIAFMHQHRIPFYWKKRLS